MARRTNRARTKRKSSGAGPGLIAGTAIVVIAGIIGLVGLLWFIQQEPDINFANNCSKNSPLRSTLIFVDDTTPLTQTQAIRVRTAIRERTNISAGDHEVYLTSVRNALGNNILSIGCIAQDPDGSEFNALMQNRSILEKQRAEFFNEINGWMDNIISVESYGVYLATWAEQFAQTGVDVTTTDTEVQLVLSSAVTFDTGSDRLNDEGQDIIRNLARKLSEETGNFSVRVVGHTDDVGDSGRNQVLSERRAANVATLIIRGGIKAEDVTTAGRGQALPIAVNTTEEGRRANRRVEITLAPKRQLLEALDRALALMAGQRDTRGHSKVVMISDLAQASPKYSVYSDLTWSDFISSPQGSTLNLNEETNLNMVVYQILREETLSSKTSILDFWRQYFRKKNIEPRAGDFEPL